MLTVGQRLLNSETALDFFEWGVPAPPEDKSLTKFLTSWVVQMLPGDRRQPPRGNETIDVNAEDLLQRINALPIPDSRLTMSTLKAHTGTIPTSLVGGRDARSARYSFQVSEDYTKLTIAIEYSPMVALLLDGWAQRRYMEYVYPNNPSQLAVSESSGRRSPARGRSPLSPGRTAATSPVRYRATSPARGRAPLSGTLLTNPSTRGPTTNQPTNQASIYSAAGIALVQLGTEAQSTSRILATHRDQPSDAAAARKTRALGFIIEMEVNELNIRFSELVFPSITLLNGREVEVDPPTSVHTTALQTCGTISAAMPLSGLATNLMFIHSLGWKLAHQTNTNLPIALQDNKTFTPAILNVDTHRWHHLVLKNYGKREQDTGVVHNGTLLWSVLMKLMLQAPTHNQLGWVMLLTHERQEDGVNPTPLLSMYDNGNATVAPSVSIFDGNDYHRRPSMMYITTLSENLERHIASNCATQMTAYPGRPRLNAISATVTLEFEANVYNHTKDTEISVSETPNINNTIPSTADYHFSHNVTSRVRFQVCVVYSLVTKTNNEAVEIKNVFFTWQPLQESTNIQETVNLSQSSQDAAASASSGLTSSLPKAGMKRAFTPGGVGCDTSGLWTQLEYQPRALRMFSEVHDLPTESKGARLFAHSDGIQKLCIKLDAMLTVLELDHSKELVYSDALALQAVLCGKDLTSPNVRSVLKGQIDSRAEASPSPRSTSKKSKHAAIDSSSLADQLLGEPVEASNKDVDALATNLHAQVTCS